MLASTLTSAMPTRGDGAAIVTGEQCDGREVAIGVSMLGASGSDDDAEATETLGAERGAITAAPPLAVGTAFSTLSTSSGTALHRNLARSLLPRIASMRD